MACNDTHYAVCEDYAEIPEQGDWYGNIEDAMSDGDEFDSPVIYEITVRKIRVGIKKIEWERA